MYPCDGLQALAGALDFSSSSKPGLPTQLQSFSQEFAPHSSLAHQDLARCALEPALNMGSSCKDRKAYVKQALIRELRVYTSQARL